MIIYRYELYIMANVGIAKIYLSLGIQGPDIGDVKFNEDGDAMGRYSVYQYQRQPKENSKGKYPDTF